MSRSNFSMSKVWLMLCVSLLIVAMLIRLMGIELTDQQSESMPKGWYLIVPADQSLSRNEWVVFDPPATVTPFLNQVHWMWPHSWLFKIVYGVPGDQVCVQSGWVWINHQKIAPVLKEYAPNKFLPETHFCGVLPKDQYWLMSTHVSRSFDSRYFGPVPRENIRGRAIAIGKGNS
ncbi:MAG: signal peptidase I [Gammaproteobacteria bacterium]|nr:signal peptidase I [Gammaproteobacteria bacterium]